MLIGKEKKQKDNIAGLEVRVEVIKGCITQTDRQQYVQELKQYGDFNNSNFQLRYIYLPRGQQ